MANTLGNAQSYTPSDTDTFFGEWVSCGVAGDIALSYPWGNTTIAANAGQWYAIPKATKILATGTTATSIVVQ